jgi:putative transposase
VNCNRLIDAEKAHHPISRLARVLGVARAGSYALAVLRRQTPRPGFEPADVCACRDQPRAARVLWSCSRQAETLLGWHRRLGAGAWTYPHRGTGRPPLDQELQQLIVRLARGEPALGLSAHQGRAAPAWYGVSATAICTTLRRHGLDPTRQPTATTWLVFLRQQAAGMVACDFFTVATVWLRRL